MLVMPIVARQSPHLPPSALWFFWRGHGWFFDVQAIFTDLHNRSIICQLYPSIIPMPATRDRSPVTIIDRLSLLSIACHCYRSPVTVIDRLSLLSIARHCYRSPVTVIDRPSLLSIACHCYRSSVTIIDRPSRLSIVRHCYRSWCNANRVHNLLIMIIVLG